MGCAVDNYVVKRSGASNLACSNIEDDGTDITIDLSAIANSDFYLEADDGIDIITNNWILNLQSGDDIDIDAYADVDISSGIGGSNVQITTYGSGDDIILDPYYNATGSAAVRSTTDGYDDLGTSSYGWRRLYLTDGIYKNANADLIIDIGSGWSRALRPLNNNEDDLGTISYQFRDGFFQGCIYNVNGDLVLDSRGTSTSGAIRTYNNTFPDDLGTSTYPWRSLYLSGGIYDGASFGTSGYLLATNGSNDIYWTNNLPSGDGDYIQNRSFADDNNQAANFSITGSGYFVDQSSAPDRYIRIYSSAANYIMATNDLYIRPSGGMILQPGYPTDAVGNIQIKDGDGTEYSVFRGDLQRVGIGYDEGIAPTTKLDVYGRGSLTAIRGNYNGTIYGYFASASYGAYGQYDASHYGYLGSSLTGAYGYAYNTSGSQYGGYFIGGNTDGNTNTTYGVYAFADGWDGTNYGVYASALGDGSGIAYGIYATAASGGTNWAGYFDGNVGIAANGYLNFSATNGFGGYGFRDNGGIMEYKNSGGSWSGFPDAPPAGSETEWWYRPSAALYITPMSNANIRIYDSGQTYGLYYDGSTNQYGGYFRTSSATSPTSALVGYSDVSGNNTYGYLGYNGTWTAPTAGFGDIYGAAVYGVVDDPGRAAGFFRTTGSASYAANIAYSDVWIPGFFYGDYIDDAYIGRPAIYGSMNTHVDDFSEQAAIWGRSEYLGGTTANSGFTIGGKFAAYGNEQDAIGLTGYASGDGVDIGVEGSNDYGSLGQLAVGDDYGVYGSSYYGGYFDADSGSGYYGVYANGYAGYGGYFACNSSGGWGIYAIGASYAGFFSGDVYITGNLDKGSGSFLIDHPDDPLNKTLRHNFVESPENLCIYRGKTALNADGMAKIKMPDYFVSLTKEEEATVTLTSIGKPFDAGYEWNKDFTEVTIYGDANREVSYIVLADRDDPVIRVQRRPVVEEKGPQNKIPKGVLYNPEPYGYPKEMGLDYWKKAQSPERKTEIRSVAKSMLLKSADKASVDAKHPSGAEE